MITHDMVSRSFIALLGALALSLSFVACGNKVHSEAKWGDVSYDINVEELSTNVIKSDELLQKLVGKSILGDVDVNYSVIKYTSRYKGEPIELSGLVAWPNTNTINEVVIGNHWTIASDAECPSKALSYDMALAVTQGALVVNADYLGYGITSGHVHPYLCAEETARQSVDCFRAALKYIATKGVELSSDFDTYNIGYSQGGAVALAVQRFIESDSTLASTAHLRKTLCGAGPYDPVASYDAYMLQDTVEYPVAIPLIIMGMCEAHPDIMDGIKAEDFFSRTIVDAGVLDSLRSKNYTSGYINNMIAKATGGALIDRILSAEALDVNSTLAQVLAKALKANNLTQGWLPKAKVQFFHSTDDNVVPFVNYESIVANLPSGTMEGPVVGSFGSHTAAGLGFYSQVIMAGINK